MTPVWLISTDMDGTLLNHEDYSWEPVKPCLAYLQSQQIPVILNTSKTYAEVITWVQRLALSYPFIVENGSAIYCPQGYFPADLLDQSGYDWHMRHGYQLIALGKPLAELQAFLQQESPPANSLVDCPLDEAIELTGLSPEEAQQARQREFTLPLAFTDPARQQAFARRAQKQGYQLLQGGRFAHLMGACDKGKAIKVLVDLYEKMSGRRPRLVALGDSGNDRAMLEVADKAVVIRNHKGDWLTVSGGSVYNTHFPAPNGWVEGVVQALSEEYEVLRRFQHG